MNISVTPPVSLIAGQSGTIVGSTLYVDTGTAYHGGFLFVDVTSGNLVPAGISNGTNGVIGIGTNSYPFTWAAGDILSFSGSYEVA